ncbi:MAG: sigma-70 family RNA polymerase sigma factor [Ruminococcus sp.]|nr:sigma-70 family RNA polymerase sigma factor [Ruminococcus sp.]
MQKRLKSEFLNQEEFCADKEISALIGDENSNTVKHSLMLKIMNSIIENDLTERQRQMITMYYFQHIDIPEIADKLGVNRSTVSRTISRGRKNIAKKMKYFVA